MLCVFAASLKKQHPNGRQLFFSERFLVSVLLRLHTNKVFAMLWFNRTRILKITRNGLGQGYLKKSLSLGKDKLTNEKSSCCKNLIKPMIQSHERGPLLLCGQFGSCGMEISEIGTYILSGHSCA